MLALGERRISPEDGSISSHFSSRTWRLFLHAQAVLAIIALIWYSFALDSDLSIANFSSPWRQEGIKVAWGLRDESITRTVLPAPYSKLELITVQAAIRSVDETYRSEFVHKESHFVQVLSMLTEIDPPPRPEEWQIFVRNATYLQRVRCSYIVNGVPRALADGSFRIPWMWDLPGENSGAALLLHCPVPADLEEDLAIGTGAGNFPTAKKLQVRIFLDLEKSSEPFQLLPVDLEPYFPPPTAEVGMCVSPIFGEWHAHNLVDWREHHKLLGFGPVHWYARREEFSDFIDHYPTAAHSRDTFRYSPPIHPGTYNTTRLGTDGLYADQVLYALDCMIRSTYLAPSNWLAFFDLDEYFLPDPMPASTKDRERTAIKYLQSMGDSVASVSLGRTHLVDNSHLSLTWAERTVDQQLAPRASLLETIRSPHKDDWPGNYKHMHRVSGVEATSVHAPTSLYPGFTYVPPIVPSEMRIVHLGRTPFTEGPYEKYERTPQVQEFLSTLAAAKTENVEAIRKSGGALSGYFWVNGDGSVSL